MKKLKSEIAAIVAVTALSLGLSASAQATTYCVPTLSACPSGTGVAVADLEEAMGLNGKDGVADTVYLAAGTLTETGSYEPPSGFKSPGTIEPQGTDPLTVIGVGPASVITSSGSGNIYLMALGSADAREVSLRDLTLQVPTTFGAGNGAALQMSIEDRIDDVAIVSLNSGSDGIVAVGTGNEVHTSVLRGEGGGSIDNGVNTFFGGGVSVEGTELVGVSWPLIASSAGVLTARRVNEVGSRTYGAVVTGGSMRIENSVFTLDDGIGLYASASTEDSTLEADHLTVVNDGSSYPALEGKKFAADAGDATIVATNSIFRGFSLGYKMEAPFGPGVGLVNLTARYSNLPSNGLDAGGTADFSTGNIEADPLFNADLSLPPTSPSVDAGDPAPGGLATDFLGAPRPNDGNGDGLAVRDQGAFEYQRPAPPSGGGTGGGAGGSGGGGKTVDQAAPQTTIFKGPGSGLANGKAKFRFRANEPGSTFVCKLDKRKAKPCKSPKTYSGLKPGRHVFKAWATDKAGNKDKTPAKRRFRVPV